jgi:hypothetical protein
MGFFKSRNITVSASFKMKKAEKDKVQPDQNGGVIMMMSDDLESFLSKENSENRSSNRSRFTSNGDSTLSSITDTSCYSVPPIFDTANEILAPPKISLHRRNRHVLASSSCSSSHSPSNSPKKMTVKKKEKSIRRRRNRAWNQMDFESMGFTFLSKEK